MRRQDLLREDQEEGKGRGGRDPAGLLREAAREARGVAQPGPEAEPQQQLGDPKQQQRVVGVVHAQRACRGPTEIVSHQPLDQHPGAAGAHHRQPGAHRQEQDHPRNQALAEQDCLRTVMFITFYPSAFYYLLSKDFMYRDGLVPVINLCRRV